MISYHNRQVAHHEIDHIFQDLFPSHGMTARPSQIELSHKMLDAMIHSKIALSDAGTGIGKTYAYLVAGVSFSRALSRENIPFQPILISTSSIALQTAVREEYIPFLSSVLLEDKLIQAPIRAVIRKGKGHYVCDERLMRRLRQVDLERKNPLAAQALLSLRDHLDADQAPHLSQYDRNRVCVPTICDCRRDSCRYLCYQRGADGKPEIVPEEAEVVRRIYRRYLDGCSEGQIQRELTQAGIATAKGVKAWSHQIVHNILTNEKYVGDALLQKTFTKDCISKKVKKNTGELPQYYIKDNHPAIIPRDIYQRVQEEMARRTSKRKILQKSGKTEQGKYSAKYALSERLVCGECGSPYKRCTWARNGVKRIVWRCVSRLEFGKKYCHESPSVEEYKLHAAILTTLNRVVEASDGLQDELAETLRMVCTPEGDGNNLMELERNMEALTTRQNTLLDQVLAHMDDLTLTEQLKALLEEKQHLQTRIDAAKKEAANRINEDSHMAELAAYLEEHLSGFQQYDDGIVRQLVERITVVDAETIRIKFRYSDVESEQAMC